MPALLADEVIDPPTRQISSASPSPEISIEPTVTPAVSPSPLVTPLPTESPVASPSPTESPSPAVVSSPSPTPDASTLAKQRDEERLTVLVPKLQVALKDYQKRHGKYPIAATYAESWTNLTTTPLTVLVSGGFIDALPTDPQPDRKIGYRSIDGKSYSITVALEDTSRPGGVFMTDAETGAQRYIYTVTFP